MTCLPNDPHNSKLKLGNKQCKSSNQKNSTRKKNCASEKPSVKRITDKKALAGPTSAPETNGRGATTAQEASDDEIVIFTPHSPSQMYSPYNLSPYPTGNRPASPVQRLLMPTPYQINVNHHARLPSLEYPTRNNSHLCNQEKAAWAGRARDSSM